MITITLPKILNGFALIWNLFLNKCIIDACAFFGVVFFGFQQMHTETVCLKNKTLQKVWNTLQGRFTQVWRAGVCSYIKLVALKLPC